jgi:hypothetical protein
MLRKPKLELTGDKLRSQLLKDSEHHPNKQSKLLQPARNDHHHHHHHHHHINKEITNNKFRTHKKESQASVTAIQKQQQQKYPYSRENSFESYEEFVEKLHAKPETPLVDHIWSSDLINTRNQEFSVSKKIKENLKFGSLMSEDASYAMLKTYEDMIYSDLSNIYPDSVVSDQLSKTKTQLYIKRHTDESEPLNVTTSQKHNDESSSKDLMHKYYVSKKLEKAMNICDEIKRRKGELVTTNASTNKLKASNLIGDYEKWKKYCFKI